MKVKDLKVGMILTPSVNKWTKLKGLFRLSNVPMKDPATQKIVNRLQQNGYKILINKKLNITFELFNK